MMTGIGWTATPLTDVLTIARDLRVDAKVFLAAGRYAAGSLLSGFTFNPWLGCEKVSRACKRCYAEAWSRRVGYTPDGHHHLRLWGPAASTPRVRTSAANWKKPLRWNRLAAELGVRLKVFCGSLCDVGEDHPLVGPWREELFALIDATPHLDWLLLTKRPAHLAAVWPERWRRATPRNVWVGSTVEDQECAEERVPALRRVRAALHFLSCEPLAGAIDLDPITCHTCGGHEVARGEPGDQPWCAECDAEMGGSGWLDPTTDTQAGVDWVIGGGESGPGHETMDLGHFLDLHRQVTGAGVPWFSKQDSGPHPGAQGRIPDGVWATKQFPQRGELFQ